MKNLFLTKTRWLVTIILLTALGSGNVWGADATMTAGTNGSSASVSVGGVSHSAIKVGTNKAGGTMTITIPTNAKKLSLYAAAWNGVNNLSLNITPKTKVSPTSIALTANSGIANNSPFTFNGSADNYLSNIDLSSITTETTLTFTSSIAKRFVVWGAKYVFNPTSPTNTTVGSTTATLGWSYTNNTDKYEVYYSTSNIAPTASTTPSIGSSTIGTTKSADLTGLTAGTTYYWWVRAVDDYCKSAWVAGTSFTTASAGGCSNKVALTKGTPSNGTFSLNKSNGSYDNCDANFVVTVSGITPDEGYVFDEITVTGADGKHSISGPDGSGNYTVTYTKGNSITSTINVMFKAACLTPTFSPVAGVYTETQTVTISCATTGATIYYTTDGNTPTTSSSVYSTPLTVSSTTTIKAIAVKAGLANSEVASGTFTIKNGKIFQLVTKASDLAAGDELVILGSYNSNNYLMSTTQNNNNRGKTDENSDWELMGPDVFVEEKVGSTVQVIELEGSAEGWYFKVGEDGEEVPQYLYAASSSSNYLRTADLTTAGDNAKWTIEIGSADTYYATITAQGSNTRNIMRYNGSNSPPIFSCYGSASQQPIQLYRYANTAPRVNVGTPSGNSFSYVYKNGPSDAQTFTVSGNNLTGNVVITPPSNYQIKNGSGEWGTSAITLTPDGNGAIAATTISVRLAGGLSTGSYDGNITFTNNDELTIPNIAVTGTVSKATLNPLFEMATYTIVRNVSTSTTFAFVNLPDDYTGAVTYSRTTTPTPSARLVIDGTNKTFTAADYSGRWTVTANFPADANYNLKNGVTCTVNALTRDTYVDNVNSQSVTEGQRTDNGVDPYVSPALSDVVPGSACKETKVHLIGWASQAFVTNVGNGTLTGADSDYTVGNGFYAVGATLPAASGTTYYAVYGEEE